MTINWHSLACGWWPSYLGMGLYDPIYNPPNPHWLDLTQLDSTWLDLTQLDSNRLYSPCHAQVWINLDLPLITELHCREEEADKAIDGSDVSRPRNLGKVSYAQAIVKSKAVSGKCQRGEENYNMIVYFMHDAM